MRWYFVACVAGRYRFRKRTNPVCQSPYLCHEHCELSLLAGHNVVQFRDCVLLVSNAGLQVNDFIVVHTGDSTADSANLQSPGACSVYPCGFSDTLPT